MATAASAELILSGAAAAARGAVEAGVGLAVTYPGSPVVETYDVLAEAGRAHVAVNEHVAFHQAQGFAWAGGRSLVIMKHVGLNVCADPAHYAGYTGVVGGMVVLVGTDPGASCSTGEFDCRLYSLHTHLPVLEPGTVQEALDWTRDAFTLSEALALPVMVFLPARLCYGMGTARSGPGPASAAGTNSPSFSHRPELTNVGPRAVERHRLLLEKIERLRDGAAVPGRPPDFLRLSRSKDLFVTSGIHREALLESLALLGSDAPVFAPALTYPVSRAAFGEALDASAARRVVVVEDGEGFLELQLSRLIAREGLGLQVTGKDRFPAQGALEFQRIYEGVGEVLGKKAAKASPKPGPEPETDSDQARAGAEAAPVFREGTFCPGCPHRAFFDVLRSVLRPEDVIGGDIGCSSLPPHFSDWLTCMNSGAAITSGLALAFAGVTGDRPRFVSVIGDSTLLHSGLQTVIDCAQRDSDQICFVLDNSWTAMTGHQPTPASPRDEGGRPREGAVDLLALLQACGVKRVVRAEPTRVPQLRRLLLEELRRTGFSVVLVERECKLQERRRAKDEPWVDHYAIVEERCRSCNRCYSVLTCPAIAKGPGGVPAIDPDLCASCSMCRQVCPNGAVVRIRERRPR